MDMDKIIELTNKFDAGEPLTVEEEKFLKQCTQEAFNFMLNMYVKMLSDIKKQSALGSDELLRIVTGVYSIYLMVLPYPELINMYFDGLLSLGNIMHNQVKKKK